MDEYSTIQNLFILEGQKRHLQIRRDLEPNNEEKEEITSAILKVEEELGSIMVQLITGSDKNFSKKSRAAIIQQLLEYRRVVEEDISGHYLPKSQNTIFAKELFSLIFGNLARLLQEKSLNIEVPVSLVFTKDDRAGIRKEAFVQFINDSIKAISNVEEIDFIKLRKFVDEFKEEAKSRFF